MSEKSEEPVVLFATTVKEIQAVADTRLHRRLSAAEIEMLLQRMSEIIQVRVGWQSLLSQCVEEIELEAKYKKWLTKVDKSVWGLAGCSMNDLPDFDYHSLYIVGSTPMQAAKSALSNAGFDQSN